MTRQQALNHADQAPRCQHYHLTGRRCGSPALTGQRLCYYHQQTCRPKLPNYKLPLLEDATSVQFGLVQVARALEDKAYDTKTSALLLYALQTASSNLRRIHEESDRERRELERLSQPEPMSTESFADMMIRGLGLRPPDEAQPRTSHAEDAEPSEPWPPQAFPGPVAEALDGDFTEEPNEQIAHQAPSPNVQHHPRFDEVFPLDPPAQTARRGPVSAPRSRSNDQRRKTND